MEIIEVRLPAQGRGEPFRLRPMGDLHVGSRDCAEDLIKRTVDEIAADDRCLWFCGGDVVDLIALSDVKRFDPYVLPDWILEGDAPTIRQRLANIAELQMNRAADILAPIADKCVGFLRGNHEFEFMKRHGVDPTEIIMNRLNSAQTENGVDIQDLSDCAIINLFFRRGKDRGNVRRVPVWVEHGFGGGRSKSSEINHLMKVMAKSDCPVVMRGHSHTYAIVPPEALIDSHMERSGAEHMMIERHGGNWGTYLKSYMVGQSSYVSRKSYPPRPMWTCYLEVKPFIGNHNRTDLELKGVRLI